MFTENGEAKEFVYSDPKLWKVMSAHSEGFVNLVAAPTATEIELHIPQQWELQRDVGYVQTEVGQAIPEWFVYAREGNHNYHVFDVSQRRDNASARFPGE